MIKKNSHWSIDQYFDYSAPENLHRSTNSCLQKVVYPYRFIIFWLKVTIIKLCYYPDFTLNMWSMRFRWNTWNVYTIYVRLSRFNQQKCRTVFNIECFCIFSIYYWHCCLFYTMWFWITSFLFCFNNILL